jgi:hypothetical protein
LAISAQYGYICTITSSSHLLAEVHSSLWTHNKLLLLLLLLLCCNVNNLTWYTPLEHGQRKCHLWWYTSAEWMKPLLSISTDNVSPTGLNVGTTVRISREQTAKVQAVVKASFCAHLLS